MTVTPLRCAVVACGIIVSGCAGADTSSSETVAASEPVAAPAPRSPVSINAEMVALVDHAGHALWEVEKAGMAPTTDAAWAEVEEHAVQLAAAGTLVRLEGTGVNDQDWVREPEWQRWSRAMSDAGVAASQAARAQNMDALIVANGQLVESCEGCHKAFKPDLPSEGILHTHSH